jgi:hypothetical protein
MQDEVQRRPVRILRIHCPAAAATVAAMRAGHIDAIERDAVVAPLLAIIRADNPLGDFGTYQNVVEIALGAESFVPTAASTPTEGVAGAVSVLPNVILTTYIADGAAEALVSAALAEIVAAHPWEVPVIEIVAAEMLVKA